MAKPKRQRNLDDLAGLVSDLIDQIKVLVSAVDDLRCEVEWWARNAVDQRDAPISPIVQHQTGGQRFLAGDGAESDTDEVAGVLESAAGSELVQLKDAPIAISGQRGDGASARLRKLEARLTTGSCTPWSNDLDGNDAPDLPEGVVISADPDLWEAILDVRPAHVVGQGCCCEEGMGPPYLLAWQTDEGCFLKELSDDDARQLQRACLYAQAGTKGEAESRHVAETQLGFW